jgi:ammonia channel protein AmtB
MFAVTVLMSEFFVVLFATLVAHGLQIADRGVVWGVGGAAMIACALATGLVRRGRAGYVLGTVVQVLLVVSGLALPSMFVIGGIFVVLWIVSLRVGARIDTERQERYRAELAHRAGQAGTSPADR